MKRAALLVAFNVVVSLFLVELGLRVLRPAPIFESIVVDDTFPTASPAKLQYVLSPNRKLIYVPRPDSGEFNHDGYRGRLYPRERQSGLTRIVVIGDSVVEGLGLNADQRFTSVLSERLGPGYEIINLGVRGYGLLQELEYLKERGLAYSPDHVMFGITGNDLQVRSAEWDSLVRKFENIQQSSFYRSYYGARDEFHARLLNLHLYRHLLYLWMRMEGGHGPFTNPLEESEREHTLDPSAVGGLIDELVTLAGAHGFGLSFVLLPINTTSNFSRSPLDVIGGAALQHGVPVLDLDDQATRELTPSDKLEMFLFHDPYHLTVESSIWTADRIADRIDSLIQDTPARG